MANQVITRKALRNELIKALSKQSQFKAFIREIKDKLNEWSYLQAFKFKFDTRISFKVNYIYDEEEHDSLDFKASLNGEITILASKYNLGEVLPNITNIIIDKVLDGISSSDLRGNGTFESLKIEDNLYIYLEQLIAWDYDTVGIYHVEQECGEGWIILPKEPKDNKVKGFYNFK